MTKLVCRTSRKDRGGVRCTGLLGWLPGGWTTTRTLRRGETARTGHGALRCARCGTRWEIAPTETVRPVLARVA